MAASVDAQLSSEGEAQNASLQPVMQALETLYRNPAKEAKDQANAWLQDFQKTPEAWQTANALLLAQDLPIEPRLFAAQMFRTKTMFDLDQVPTSSRGSLRDTLVTALAAYASGPRVIQTQICLALAGLAIQLTDEEWPDVVKSMTAKFGSNPTTVGVLLEFLTVLPEEVTGNHRIPVETDHYNLRVRSLLGSNADEILRLLSMYLQAPGITSQIQASIFQCLRSWLKAGEIATTSLLETPLFQFSFDALASDELFDVATDVVCDLIHETQEVEENMNAIPLIVHRLLPLREELAQAGDDEDKMRGICRIFAQAGETYHTLILRHQDFFPIVQTLIECAAYHDLDIVSITFRFWYLLGSALGKRKEDPSLVPFLQVYARLLDIIIGHLRFPDDEGSQTAAERDEFRSFRHFMGDTLKDCCYVLGSKECLSRSLQMIRDVLASAQSSGHAPRWQDVEAPLFSMRAMGTEVSPTDQNDVIGNIIDIIPDLPAHPRMRYAGLLVISRYTEWIDHHPDRIPGLLSYISAGLESEGDVAAAAGQAMSYLCQDCRRHLVPYLPQLYAFLGSVGDRLEPDDLITMGEGVGHIVSTLSPQDALPAMMEFSQPALELIASVSSSEASSRVDLKRANIRIDMIERFLETIGARFQDALPADCATKTVADAYAVMDGLLAKHGSAFWIHQSSVNLFRRAMNFFGPHARGILPALLDRMSSLFQATGFSGYLWIMGRIVEAYGPTADGVLKVCLQNNYEKVSSKVLQVLENSMPREIPDIIEDYVEVSATILAELPSLLILTPIFPHAFRAAVTALTLVQPSIIHRGLDFIRAIVGHDALAVAPTASQPGTPLSLGINGSANGYADPAYPAYASAIRNVLSSQGYDLLALLLEGLVTTFPPEQIQLVTTIFRVLVSGFPRECLAWIGPAVDALPVGAVGHADKVKFLERFAQSVERGDLPAVKTALTEGIYRASRKSRERSRMDTAVGAAGGAGAVGGDSEAAGGGYVDR